MTETPRKKGAGDRTRTDDIQLGNVAPAPVDTAKVPESQGAEWPQVAAGDRSTAMELALSPAQPGGLAPSAGVPRPRTRPRKRTHAHWKTGQGATQRADGFNRSEYQALADATQRCHNPRHRYYASYGGRGIRVCDEWRGKGGFARFLEHIGPKPLPGLSLDRIDNARATSRATSGGRTLACSGPTREGEWADGQTHTTAGDGQVRDWGVSSGHCGQVWGGPAPQRVSR